MKIWKRIKRKKQIKIFPLSQQLQAVKEQDESKNGKFEDAPKDIEQMQERNAILEREFGPNAECTQNKESFIQLKVIAITELESLRLANETLSGQISGYEEKIKALNEALISSDDKYESVTFDIKELIEECEEKYAKYEQEIIGKDNEFEALNQQFFADMNEAKKIIKYLMNKLEAIKSREEENSSAFNDLVQHIKDKVEAKDIIFEDLANKIRAITENSKLLKFKLSQAEDTLKEKESRQVYVINLSQI